MGFLFKFLKEMNSAGSEKLISLAVVLGLICGFLPFFNVFTFLFLFIAFIIRIPFGLFLASWGVFGVVGYFLDPIFARSGYLILSSSFLQPLWEFIYNIPLMRWSGYNNTVVMGGLVWGMLFGVLLFFVLSKSIGFYRKKLMDFCSKYSALKWIVPDFSQKTKFIRISGVLGFFIIFGGIFLTVLLLFDPIAKKATEYSLSKVLQKPVKIGNFNTSFFNAEINLDNLEVDEYKADRVNLKLSWDYLLWKKFDIESLKITNIHISKSLKDIIGVSNQKEDKKHSDLLKNVNFSLPKPEELINKMQLESMQKIEKLKKDYNEFSKIAKEVKKDLADSKKSIDEIKSKIQELQNLSKNIKSPADVQKIITKTEEIKKSINSVKNKIESRKNKLIALKKTIMKDLEDIKKASQDDYKKLASKYDMLKKGEYVKLTQTFLEPEVKKYVDKFMQYYKLAKPYFQKEKQYIRAKGRYIKFKDKIKYPDFVLEKADISAKNSDAKMKIKIVNISSDQHLLNKYGVIKISALSQYFKSAIAEIKYLEKISINMNVKEIFIKRYSTGGLSVLNPKIDVKAYGEIKGDNIDLTTSINIRPEKIIYNANKYISKALKKLKKLNVKIKLYGSMEKYGVKITSDIDKLFASYLKDEMNAQVNKAKTKLKEMLNKQIQSKIAKTGFDMNQFNIINDISSLENGIDSLKNSLSQYTEKQLSKKLFKKGIGNFIKF